MTSSTLPGTLNAKDSGDEGCTFCARAVADKSKNGECYNVYGENGQVTGSNRTQPDPGSGAIKNCILAQLTKLSLQPKVLKKRMERNFRKHF